MFGAVKSEKHQYGDSVVLSIPAAWRACWTCFSVSLEFTSLIGNCKRVADQPLCPWIGVCLPAEAGVYVSVLQRLQTYYNRSIRGIRAYNLVLGYVFLLT